MVGGRVFDQSLEPGLNITDSSVDNVLKSPKFHLICVHVRKGSAPKAILKGRVGFASNRPTWLWLAHTRLCISVPNLST